jgi:hypothetical protein
MDQYKQDILFIAVMAMYKSNKQDLVDLVGLAKEIHGESFRIMPDYMGSQLELQINATMANIEYAKEKMDSIICLN